MALVSLYFSAKLSKLSVRINVKILHTFDKNKYFLKRTSVSLLFWYFYDETYFISITTFYLSELEALYWLCPHQEPWNQKKKVRQHRISRYSITDRKGYKKNSQSGLRVAMALCCLYISIETLNTKMCIRSTWSNIDPVQKNTNHTS